MTPSTDWRETIPDGEEAELEAFALELAKLQADRRARGGGPDRALHAKGHAALLARFTVDDGLPPHARQGLFARPGSYKAFVRVSNGSGGRAPDRAPDVRGLAIKVLGVEGDKVLGDASTQDFLAIDSDRTPVRNPREFVTLVRAASGKRLLRTLASGLGLGRTFGLLFDVVRSVKGRPFDLLDVTFNTVLPIAFGPYAARLAFVPRHAPTSREGAAATVGQRIAARAAREQLRWEVRAQFFTGETTPIEHPHIAWPSSFEKVGELTTVATSAPELADFVEKLSFDPWHALVAHRPLGAMMRARKHAYFHSVKAREALAEPGTTEWEGFAPSPT